MRRVLPHDAPVGTKVLFYDDGGGYFAAVTIKAPHASRWGWRVRIRLLHHPTIIRVVRISSCAIQEAARAFDEAVGRVGK